LKTLIPLLSLLLIPLSAIAQPSAEDIERYRTLTADAGVAYEDGDYRKTIALLSEAQTINDHPDLTYNIGRAYEAMSWCGRARETFSVYVKRKDVSRKDRTAAGERLEDLNDCVEKRQITVRCEPGDATLKLNDSKEMSCHTPFEVGEGSYTISVSRDGYLPSVLSVNVNAFSDDIEVEARLTPAPVDEIEPIAIPEERSSQWRPTLGWTLLGVGTAALVTAVILDATAGIDSVDPDKLAEAEADAESRRTLTTGLYIGGLVIGAAGGGVLLWHYVLDEPEVAVGVGVGSTGFRVRF